MKRTVVGVVMVLILGAGLLAAEDSGSGGPGAKLRQDLKTAVENGHLSDAQKSTLKAAGQTLRDAAQAKKNGESVDRDAVKKAFGDIKTIVNSGALRPEDEQAVKADLNAMQQARKGQGRRGLFRRF